MFTLASYKHTHVIFILFLFCLSSNLLMAQESELSVLPPLSMDLKMEKLASLMALTESKVTTYENTLPKLLSPFDLSKIVIPSSPQIDMPSLNVIMDSVKIATPADTLKTTSIVSEKVVENRFYQDSTCIDLVFDTVSVIKMTEKYIEIEFSIINKGTAPAPIFGSKRSNQDNVAVHFYFSGTPRLTRGAILADGIYLTEGLRETKGMLAPNAVYKNRFKLPLEKRNHFYGVVILQLDVFDVLSHECDETNNVFAIVPKWY